MKKHEIKSTDFLEDAYTMVSARDEAQSRPCHVYVGKSGRTWLVADIPNAGDYIYCTAYADPKRCGEGFGGATLSIPLVSGGHFLLRGGWHANADALFDDTGVDVRDKHLTYVVLSKDRKMLEGTRQSVFVDVVYRDPEPTIGPFDRYKILVAQYPDARFYYSRSCGGSSSGPCNATYIIP